MPNLILVLWQLLRCLRNNEQLKKNLSCIVVFKYQTTEEIEDLNIHNCLNWLTSCELAEIINNTGLLNFY